MTTKQADSSMLQPIRAGLAGGCVPRKRNNGIAENLVVAGGGYTSVVVRSHLKFCGADCGGVQFTYLRRV